MLGFIYQMATEGLMNANVDSNGGTALFQAGDAALYWEGEWEVDVFQAAKLPFSMQPFPAVFGSGVAQADSHTFVIPRQPSADPEKLSMALTMIRTLLGQSLIWAEGGHIPAWLPVARAAAYKKLKPQSNYESVADHAVYDPPAWYSGSGSDMENYAGAAIGTLMTGGLEPAGRLPGDAPVIRDLVEGDGAGMTTRAMQLPATAARSRTRRAQARRRNVSGLGFLTPFLVLYVLFLIGPLVSTS